MKTGSNLSLCLIFQQISHDVQIFGLTTFADTHNLLTTFYVLRVAKAQNNMTEAALYDLYLVHSLESSYQI